MSYPTLPNLPPATPQKAVPGAYMQTPAVARHDSLFKSPMQPTSPRTPMTPMPKLPPTTTTKTLSAEERGAHTISQTLAMEAQYPDLDSYLSQGVSSEYDIPTAQSWAPFQKVKMYNIPDQIFDQYNRAQVSTSMGLFAELNHAWVAIDNALYLWDFTHPNPQLVGFEEQPNSINAVKLVKPRAGVFLPAITHMLVVSTTAEVILLGMSCETTPTGSKQVALYQTGMAVSIRGLDIHVFASSDTGRIFFGGSSDNDIYELTYQQEERWFQGRCGKVNHTSSRLSVFSPSISLTNLAQRALTENVEQMVVDDSRKLLYTLSSASTIRVFHLRADGSLNLVITKIARDIYSNIGHIIGSNETLNERVQIVSISPVPAAEASRYHLVATTATGYRIYLSATGSYSWAPSQNGTNPPTSMQAQHIKTPPIDNAANASMTQQFPMAAIKYPIHSLAPTRMASRFPPGYFFCFTCKDATQKADTLFVSSPDPGLLARPAREQGVLSKSDESGIWLSLGGRAEDIGLCSPPPPTTSAGFGNELAIQFDHPAAEVAILTNSGIHIVRRRRLVDMFAALVRSGGTSEEGLEGEVVNLIKKYGRSEVLATALAVACGQGVEISSDQRLTQINDPDVLEFARKVFIEYGGRPQSNENAVPDSTSAIDAWNPSPRHHGIALYMSRLLRSIWQKQIAKVGSAPNGAMTVAASVAASKLQTIQHDLAALQDFFKTNKSFIEGLSGPEALARVTNKQEETALQAEHRALHSLVQLVSHTIEGISFVLVLFDERVDEIVTTLPAESKERFLKLTFEELFSSSKGHDIAKELVKGIVNRNIAKGSNVETVADALRRRCGSFCSAEDVIIFKAQELLKRATEAGANSELGRNLLNESLHLFQQVADSLPMDYLVSAVDNYIANQFFAGAIQLALNVAGRSDKANIALSWIMDGRPAQDTRKEYFYFRKQCYDLISKVVLAVDTLAASDPGYIDGQLTIIAKRQNEAYGVISDSTDEVFLTSLYDWYLEQGWNDRLLQTQSPFVVTYLERKSTDDIAHADLLWRYYAQSQRFFEAAKVQFQLAQSAFTLPLSRRIEYLGRARTNASTFTPDVGRQSRQRLLQEITNLIEVANIQDDLLQRLKDDSRIAAERKVEVLRDVDGPVMDISTLFNQYADSASYYDICLQIFFAADYRNAADIKATWANLIQDVHEITETRGTPLPHEAVIEKVRSLGSRLRMSETVFPIRELVPLLERYSLEHQYHRQLNRTHWVVDLFLDLGVPHESLYGVLEAMFYTDEAPFHGSNRRIIAADLVYLLNAWFMESARPGGTVFGSDVMAERVSETLVLLQQGGGSQDIVEASQELRHRIAELVG
ncbi:non-repetitive nucleoporin [Penicillium cinerascens]|uniref:Non-repetitive nucleoporin n=1 Tax=Penicillium cinerascens TaxID=70096 RepID=A0A9W9TBQ4_9EURO|nr:non-repetitive nucleoporin [Penicillium cinerascens]KAJ5216574.1 non-repetitive nucleoporin [Penicillium cinerascens]